MFSYNDLIVAICCVTIIVLSLSIGWMWADTYFNSDLYEFTKEVTYRTDREALQADIDAIASDWAAIGFSYPYFYDPSYVPKRRKVKKKLDKQEKQDSKESQVDKVT